MILLSTVPSSITAATDLSIVADAETPATLPILVSDTEALSFLPALPPLKDLSNPNDAKALQRRLDGIQKEVEDRLMGCKMDGERTRPGAEWCIESYTAHRLRVQIKRRRRGHEGVVRLGEKEKEKDREGEGEGVVMYRVFGMTTV